MTLDHLSQAWIAICGPISIYLVNSKSPKARLAGAIIGCLAGPGWYCQMVLHDQWLILPVHMLYTACWIRGIINHRRVITEQQT